MKNFYKRHSGIWCIAVGDKEKPKTGDVITVTTKKGKEKEETIVKAFSMITYNQQRYWLCSIEGQENQQRLKKEKTQQRREAWATTRREKSNECFQKAGKMASVIPLGQPIHVGHYSENSDRAYRNKIHRLTAKSLEHQEMAERHEETAKGIKQQLKTTIFSSDETAIQKLEEKIKRLKEERERNNATNRKFRKVVKEWPKHVQEYYASLKKIWNKYDKKIEDTYPLPEGVQYVHPYVNRNISGRISQAKKRVEHLKRMFE